MFQNQTKTKLNSHLIRRHVFSVAILSIFLFEKLTKKIGIEKLLKVNVVSTHFRGKHKNYANQSDRINLITLFYLRISFLASTWQCTRRCRQILRAQPREGRSSLENRSCQLEVSWKLFFSFLSAVVVVICDIFKFRYTF